MAIAPPPIKRAPYKKKETVANEELVNLLNLAQNKNLDKVLETYEKKKEPKLPLLTRVGKALTSFETGEAQFASQFEGKKFLPQYIKSIGLDLAEALTGKQVRTKEKRTYKDVLLKQQGGIDRPGKVDRVDVGGLTFDILADPTTYLGGFIGKGILGGIKGVTGLAKKAPLLGTAIEEVGNLFTPAVQKAAKPLVESGDPYLQRIGRKFEDVSVKYQKGTMNTINASLKPLSQLEKQAKKTIGRERFAEITAAKELGEKTGEAFVDEQVEFFTKAYDNIKTRELKEGILKSGRENYVRRIATPEFLKELDARGSAIYRGMPKPIRVKIKAADPRKLGFKTIQEANEWSKNKLGVKMFEENPYKALAYRMIESEKAIQTSRYLKDLAVFGRKYPEKFIDEFGVKWTESTAPQLKGISLPEPIVKYVDRANTILTNDAEINKMVGWYDQMLSFWKGSVYGVFPSSHTTNALGGLFHNYIAGATNPKLYTDAELILRGSQGELTAKGTTYTFDQIRKFANDYGVIGESGYLDVPQALRITPGERKIGEAIKQGGLQTPQQIMSSIEDRLRIPLFIDGLQKGLGPNEAAKRVIKYHFDYTPLGLSDFEKSIVKRIIPFYTFTRNVIPLTLQQIFLQPQKYGAVFKLQNATGLTPDNEEFKYLPDYLRRQIVVKKDDKYFAGFKFPFEEVFGKFEEPLKGIGISATPFFKIPIEVMFDKNLFRGIDISKDVNGSTYQNMPQPIKDFLEYKEVEIPANKNTGRPGFTKYYVNPFKKYGIENFPFTSRLWNTILRLNKNKEDPTEQARIILTQIKDYEPEEVDFYKTIYERDLLTELQDIAERLGEGYRYEKFIIPKEKEPELKRFFPASP